MTIPNSPSRTTIGKRICESVTARSSYASVSGGMSSGATRMKSAVRPPPTRRKSQKSVEATRQARAFSPFSSSSLKTGTNADGERGVGDERPDQVRDLERDREGVDRAAGAEVVRGDDLADQTEDAREAGRDRERRRRPRESAAGPASPRARV